MKMKIALLLFVPLLAVASDEEWFLTGRHGGCFPIELLAERMPILKEVKNPSQLVDVLKKMGGNPTVNDIGNLNVVVMVKEPEQGIGLVFMKRQGCQEFPEKARRKPKEQPTILSTLDASVFSKQGNPIGVQIQIEIKIPKSSYQQEMTVPNRMDHFPPTGQVFTSGYVPMYRLSFPFPTEILEFENQSETHQFPNYKIVKFHEVYIPRYITQEKGTLCYKQELSFYAFEQGPSTGLLNDSEHPEKNFQVLFGFNLVGNEIRTKNLYDLRDFYQSYLKEGVKKCEL